MAWLVINGFDQEDGAPDVVPRQVLALCLHAEPPTYDRLIALNTVCTGLPVEIVPVEIRNIFVFDLAKVTVSPSCLTADAKGKIIGRRVNQSLR